MLSPPERAAATRRAHRAARDLDLDVARDGIGVLLRARAHLNPCSDRDAVAVPPEDLNTAVHAGIDAKRLLRRLHTGLANLAMTGALSPVAPASVATILEPFIVTLLGRQSSGKN